MIDKEGWYSVTPEPFAEYLAERVHQTFKPVLTQLNENLNSDDDGDDIMESDDINSEVQREE